MRTPAPKIKEAMEDTATIVVNGTSYDAISGAVLGATSAQPVRGRNIDGFFRSRTTTAPRSVDIPPPPAEDTTIAVSVRPAKTFHDVTGKPAPFKRAFTIENPKLLAPLIESAQRAINHTRARVPQTAKARTVQVSHTVTASHKLEVRRGAPNHIHHRAQQRSSTLRREYVPTPALSTHNALKPQSELQREASNLIEHKRSAVQVDPDRLVRAQSTPKSPLVARHDAAARSLVPIFTPVAVQPIPTSPSPTSPPPGEGDAPVPTSPAPTNRPDDIFTKALTRANHYIDPKVHAASYRSKARWHIASMATGTLVLVAVAGFAVWQSSPTLQFKAASMHAGVTASVPNLAGTGLSYDGVHAGDGKLTIGLTGAAGTVQVTTTNSNLSSGDLINEIGSTDASGTPQYSVLYAGQTAIYRFNNTGATWVANGKWYSLTSNQAISNTQVKAIVGHF